MVSMNNTEGTTTMDIASFRGVEVDITCPPPEIADQIFEILSETAVGAELTMSADDLMDKAEVIASHLH